MSEGGKREIKIDPRFASISRLSMSANNKEAVMKNTKKMMGLILMFAVCLGTAFAKEHRVNKKEKMTVAVEENGSCLQGFSVTSTDWDGRQLCADWPYRVGRYFRRYVGSTVEIEAQWTFNGDPKTSAPVAINKVFKVGKKKVYDPCAVSKLGLFAGMAMVAGGADPGATAGMLTADCTAASEAASAELEAALSADGNQ